jgi:hypothetical protein
MNAERGIDAPGGEVRIVVSIKWGWEDGVFQIRHSIDAEEREEGDQRGNLLGEEIIVPTRIEDEAT